MKKLQHSLVLLTLLSCWFVMPLAAAERELPEHLHKGSRIIGMSVENPQGESLGHIADVVIDTEGRIVYATLSYGGILGLGETFVAVPWKALSLKPDGNIFLLAISKETLESVQGFAKTEWPVRANPLFSASAQNTTLPSLGAPATPAKVTSPLANDIVTGTVETVDPSTGALTLKSADGNSVSLQAPAELLEGLQAGDAVEVTKAGSRVTTIHEHDKTQQEKSAQPCSMKKYQ